MNEIDFLIEDILIYLEQDNTDECTMNQVMFGIQHLFCRYIIKVWQGTNFGSNKYHDINKIIIRNCIKFYMIY